MLDSRKKRQKNLEVRIIQRNFADENHKTETICKQVNTY